MSLYRVLGVQPDASQAQLRRAYRARAKQLHPDRRGPAPSAPIGGEAMAELNEAWRVLRDPRARARYDEQRAEPPRAAAGPGLAGVRLARRWPRGAPTACQLAGAAWWSLREWWRPRHQLPRKVAVPELRGRRVSAGFSLLAAADLHLAVVRLTEPPAPVDGLVVGQWPAPGALVPRYSTVTLAVRHPPARPRPSGATRGELASSASCWVGPTREVAAPSPGTGPTG